MQRRWTVPPILWAAIINRSGHRKTALINNAFQRLQTRQTAAWRIYRREVKEWRELPRKIRLETPKPPEPHSFVVTDTTSEKLQMILAENDRGTLLLRDELAGFFEFGRYSKNSGDAERGFYLESYEANPCTVLRVGNDRRESVYIEVNGLTIFGLIQPARLDDISHRLKLDSDGCCSVLPSFSVSRPQLRG
jgi:hypothetical protein